MSSSVPEHRPTLQGRVVVVLGGSSGVGFAVAKSALAAGARVVVSSTTADKLQRTLDRLNSSSVTGRVVDIRSEKSLSAFFSPLTHIDHLIFTAGDTVTPTGPDMDVRAGRGAFNVRYFGMLDAVRHALPKFRSHYESTITLTSGVNARRVAAGFLLGSAVAAATENATRYLAQQCAPIRVNAVALGAVKTEMWDAYVPPEQQDAFLAVQAAKLPVEHIASADEVTEAYHFCWRCTYITGHVIDVDGGAQLSKEVHKYDVNARRS